MAHERRQQVELLWSHAEIGGPAAHGSRVEVDRQIVHADLRLRRRTA
jgi:hypothetical protein